MKRTGYVWAALFLLTTLHAQEKKTGGIDSILQAKMRANGWVGMSAAVIIHRQQVWTGSYGYANQEKGVPFTANTLMTIASITKTITGACLMKAVEEKKLDLDEDINRYLPFRIGNPHYPGEKITLRNLATHTSSLADRYPFYEDSTYWYGSDPKEDLGDFLRNYFVPGGSHYTPDNFLKYKPGTYRDYSNIGAALAGYIVERATGMKLNEYSREKLFRPLGMQHTGWFLPEIDLSRHTLLYEKKEGAIVSVPLYGSTTYPDGSVHTSVNELSRFFICLLSDGAYNGKQVLAKETVAEMLRFQFTAQNKPQNVDPAKLNSGIFWSTKMGGTRVGHNGSDRGVRTFMLNDPATAIGVVFFVNTSLSEKEESVFFDLYNELYKYARTLKP